MPFKKGAPGRLKGVRNKDNQLVEVTAKRLGVNIFEILCLFAMGDWKALGYESEVYFAEKADGATKMGYVISPEMRLKAAESAAKYLYSQQKALDVTSSDGSSGITIVVEDYTQKALE